MRAARYYGVKDIRVEEVPEPTIGAPDDVLVEVAWCGICGTDLHEYLMGPIVTPATPHRLTGAMLPQILGHEFSGTVVAIGSDVRDVKVGDRVAAMPSIVCGRCYHCRRGDGHLCRDFASIGLSADNGGLASHSLLKEYQVARVPDSMSDVAAAVVEPGAVAAYGIDRAGVTGGETVLISGAGPIGALSALYAYASGAGLVIVAEPNERRAAMARALDIGPVVNPGADLAELVLEETDGVGIDLAIECSGTAAGVAGCLDAVRAAGKIVQTGLHTEPAPLDFMKLSEKDVTLLGSWCFKITDWPRIIRLAATGRYPLESVVTSQIGLDEVVTGGFDALVDPGGDQVKVLIGPA